MLIEEVKVSSWNPSEAGRSGVSRRAGVTLHLSAATSGSSLCSYSTIRQAYNGFPFTEPGQWSSRHSCQGRRDRGICEWRPLGPLGPSNQLDFPVKSMTCMSMAQGQKTKSRWVRGGEVSVSLEGETCLYAPTYKINLSETRLTFRKNTCWHWLMTGLEWPKNINEVPLCASLSHCQNIWPICITKWPRSLVSILKTLLIFLVYVIFKKVGESTSIYLTMCQSLGPQLRGQ